MEKFDQLISDDRYKSLSPVDQYDVRRRFFHKVAGDERFSQLPEQDQQDIGQRILFKGTENEAPGFFEGVKRAFTSGVEATGQHLLNVYKSLDPAQAPSMLQAGLGPLMAGMAVTPPAVGGEFAGEFARKSAEQLGASPEVQAGIGTIANIAVPGGFVPEGIRGARTRAGGPLTAENIRPGAKEAPAAPAGPTLPPEIRARAESIEQQLLEAERQRAAMQLEQNVAASDIEGQAYVQGLGPKRGVGPEAGPRGAEIRPVDDAMAIMRGESEAPRVEAPPAEMQASLSVRPQAESVIPERGAPEVPADPVARMAQLEAENAKALESRGTKAPEPQDPALAARIAALEAENASLKERAGQVRQKPTSVDELMRLNDENYKLWGSALETADKGEKAGFKERLKANDDKIAAIERRINPKNIGVVEFFNPADNRGAIVHASTKEKGSYQVTYFDERGFSSDIQTKSISEALREARSFGKERTSGNLERLAKTEQFQKGNDLTRVVGMANDLRGRGNYEGARAVEDAYDKGGFESAQKVHQDLTAPKPVEKPARARLEDNEVAISTLIKRRGGINIPKNLKEEFGGWNRLHNKDAMAPDELAHEAYDLGMIERPDTNALIEGLKAGKKQSRMLGAEGQDALVVGVEADRHVKALQDAPGGVEYQGKSYDAVVPEKGGAVRLKDDPDKVLKKPSDILAIEEKIPFDVPAEKAVSGFEDVHELARTAARREYKQVTGQETVARKLEVGPGQPHSKTRQEWDAAYKDEIEKLTNQQAEARAQEQAGISSRLKVQREGEAAREFDAQYQKLVGANRTNVDALTGDVSPEMARKVLDRLDAAPGDNPVLRSALNAKLADAPRFEQTEAGMQGVFGETPKERGLPTSGLKAKRAQTEAPMDLEQPAIRAQEPELPVAKAPADLRPVIVMKDGENIVGEAGQRHDAVLAKIPEGQRGNIQDTGWVGPEGKFMTADEATEYKFKNASIPELIKTGTRIGETGAVGKLDEGMAQVEADARAARKELYERLYTYAREKGVSLKEAARDHNFLQRDLVRLEAEASQEKWGPSEAARPFGTLEKELGRSSESPDIMARVKEEFKGERLNNKTTKNIADAMGEVYEQTGKKLDPDLPLTLQIYRDVLDGVVPREMAKEAFGKRGLDFDEVMGDALLGTYSNWGKQGQQMSALAQRLKKAGIEIEGVTPPPPTGWEYSKEMSLRWLNIWRGALVTQLGTAVRNLESQGARVGIDAVEKVTDGALRQMFRLGKQPEEGLSRGFGRAMEDLVDLAKRGKRKQSEEILSLFPTHAKRMFYQYAGDVNAAMKAPHELPGGIAGKIASPFEKMTQAAEKGVEYANVLNRGQEFLIRKAAFRAKLADLLERSGQNIDSIDPRAIDEKMIQESVDHALEMTFATTPQKGPGKWLMDVYRAVPPLYLVAPFPKFMFNSWKFFTDYSPAGFLKLLSAKERAAIAEGHTKTLSRAIVGTGMLGAAYALRNSEYAGEKWYEINVGDKTFDTRPYNPFASYLFVADVINKWNKGTLDKFGFKDLTQGLLSANFRAGTGLFMLDKVADVIGGAISNQGAPETGVKDIKRAVGETAAGFLTPLQTFKDVLSDERLLGLMGQQDFAKEEGKLRDVRSDPFLGPIMSKIPGVSQKLPQTQFPLGGEAEKEEPGLRQLTGVLLRTKTDVQKEADRLGLAQHDIVSSTGITELDRKTNEIMRPVAERTLTALMSSRAYSQADDLQKKIWFQKWSHNIGNAARKEALNQNRDLRIEYVIKKAGKDQGRQLREIYQRRGLIASE